MVHYISQGTTYSGNVVGQSISFGSLLSYKDHDRKWKQLDHRWFRPQDHGNQIQKNEEVKVHPAMKLYWKGFPWPENYRTKKIKEGFYWVWVALKREVSLNNTNQTTPNTLRAQTLNRICQVGWRNLPDISRKSTFSFIRKSTLQKMQVPRSPPSVAIHFLVFGTKTGTTQH